MARVRSGPRGLLDQLEMHAGGTRGIGDGGRTGGGNGCREDRERDDDGGVVHPQAAVAPTVPGSSAARAGAWCRDLTACACCGGARLSKLGETVTETLEVIPRKSWKVIQHVREKFTCRDCEKISQAPAPFHVIARGWAGPSLLAMVLFEKFGQHQPLNRQAERYAREGVPISLSTLADQVGGCTAALMPLFKGLEAHVMGAERLHGDDTRVPVLAKGKTDTGRIWVYVRDDKPFGGPGATGGSVLLLARPRG